MQKLLLKNITFLFLFFGTALSFADTKINISESFSEEEKAAIQKMFKNFTRLKGRSVSFYYSQFFDPNSLFETTLDGTVLVEFLEERFKSILPMPESEAAPKKKSDGTEYFSIGYQKPKLVQNIEEGTSEYVREEIYLNRRFINGDINRQLSALGLLLHEAHHSGKGDPHPHVDCPSVLPTVFNRNSDFSGVKGACDEDEDGAYGLEAIFWGNLFKNSEGLKEITLKMAAAEFVKAVSRIVSLDSQRRILKDLEINGRLEYEESSAEEFEGIKKEYFQRKLIKDFQWDLKLKEELRRKEAQRQAFRKAKAEQEEKLRKQKELAQIEEARRKRLAEEEANKRYAFVLDNMSHFTINFYLSWAKGDWKQYSLKPNQKMIYNSKESEVEIFVYDNQLTHYFPNKKFSKRFNLKSKLTKKDLLNNNEEYKKFPLYYLRAEDVSDGISANPINIISVYDSNLEILRK